MNEVSLLQWVAGLPDQGKFDKDAIDPGSLLDLAYAHRLETRLWCKLVERDGALILKGPDSTLFQLMQDVKADVRRKVALLEDLQARLPRASHFIVIKGLSLYAMTCETESMRRSNDIDLLAADPDVVISALESMGFNRQNYAAPHELAVLVGNQARVDVHEYFPVYAYPAALGPASTTRSRGQLWTRARSMVQHRIAFSDLDPDCRKGFSPGTRTTWFPSAEMAALIICCSMFHDYVATSLPLPVATIRLGDVADLRRILELPEFSLEGFMELVEYFQAGDAWLLSEWALKTYVGFGTPHADGHVARRSWSRFPRDLWWGHGTGGFLVEPVWESPTDLLRRETTMEQLVREVGCTRILADGLHTYASYPEPEESLDRPFQRVMVDPTGPSLSLRLMVEWTDQALTFTGKCRRQRALGQDVVMVDFGFSRVELVQEVDPPEVHLYDWHVGDDVRVELVDRGMTHAEDSYEFYLRFPWAVLAGGAPKGNPLALMLGVRQREPVGHSTISSTLVPMSLILS